MKRAILALLILSMVVFSSFDQTYTQKMSRNGESTIEKTADMSIFAGQLSENAFKKMDEYCRGTLDVECKVDVEKKVVTITEKFSPNFYYRLTGDYGIPYTTYTLTIDRVPTDKFSETLEKILVAIGEGTTTSQPIPPLDLLDKTNNQANVETLRILGVSLDYVVEMPSQIDSAAAGKVPGIIEGNTVRFNMVDVLGESEPMIVTSREMNYGYLVAILGAVVLIALAYMFMVSSRPRASKKGTIKK
ncbi:Uncharacterised protein [Candidatus Bilamarchaeum dharawalense]|uniref:Uncharacterized protein n=1 Tax=Candidatus Bilamarchaeum dharawalense TaxID=2885759 RepID=A0A5E4LPQ6_9ARCH|nr:Uncharacterised protein [Candidatus Bilamarchaeum dharawalense]